MCPPLISSNMEVPMRTHLIAAILSVPLAMAGCKKGGSTPGGGGGGGGGGWLVGNAGLMVNVQDGKAVGGYDLGATDQLDAIACRYQGEAWVAGDHGTLLYTNDGGTTWSAQTVPTLSHLRTIATQDDGPVFVGGDGAFLVTTDTGATWKNLGDGVTNFRSLSAAYAETGALALSDDGGLWRTDGSTLTRERTLTGARAIHQTPDGDIVMTAGNGIMRSLDGGLTFDALSVDPSLTFDDIRVQEDGSAVAVGANGAIANVAADGTVSVQQVGALGLHTLHIDEEPDGYAAGDDGQVLVTHDFGLTWQLGPNVGRTVRGIDEIGFGHR